MDENDAFDRQGSCNEEREVKYVCVMDSIIYVSEMLEQSIFTWSDGLEEEFLEYVDSEEFQRCLSSGNWVLELDMVEKVAKDLVIRGYFSDNDDDADGDDHLKYSTIQTDL